MHDIAVIGGGVNGCGIARDAAGRGASVLLLERDDLASGTSSASTKLVHGGLRYLEHYEFRLVREALGEREVLWAMAPHIVRPLRFVLPHHEGLRPAWMIRLGLFLYDHLGGRKRLPACRQIDLRKDEAGRPLKSRFTRAFEYSDCRVDDSRLVVLNAMDAAACGAEVRVRTELFAARREAGRWRLALRDRVTGRESEAEARILVNATGPWVAEVLADRLGARQPARVRLVKGSHIVVPKLFDHDRAYIFQNADKRIVFAIPYEQDFTLIGTTDVDMGASPSVPRITEGEVAYLCAAVGEYFSRPVTPADVVWSYSGIRPLFDDGATAAQEATRDYVLKLDKGGGAPLLNVFGGKITTYRRLAEEALDALSPLLGGLKPAWTRGAPLPGGNFAVDGEAGEVAALRASCPAIEAGLARRLVRTYGTRAREVLRGVASKADLGEHFGAGLYRREVEYLVRHEWAATADDILWRRTKLGLRLDEEGRARLESFLAAAAR